ncbi:MAG: DNA mismatch repair endonuclease MutL [Deltaproteobacteria bacterium]|nr:DNA mismatch repair endonuclease MutL [Deltaproteobacteria bacterium]
MPKINILDSLLASKIAAGEVIDRPSSVVKELIENSIDAGASSVSVFLAEGGKRVIKVNDDGEGISREDAPLAFLRHATSKISKEEDLEAVLTMGFRGEALASVAAVSRVTLKTRRRIETEGTLVSIEGGGAPVVSGDGCPEGTSIEVRDLFFNTPARLKFLRSSDAEYGRSLEIFKRLALINPKTRFKIQHGSGRPLETPPGALKDRIFDLFGISEKDIMEVSAPFVEGYIGAVGDGYPTSRWLLIYVNGRVVRDKSINRAVIDGYGQMLPPGRFPFVVLDLKIPPEDVDINIHPTKSEVRFKNQSFAYDAVKLAVRGALGSALSPPAYPSQDRESSLRTTSYGYGRAFPPTGPFQAKEAAGAGYSGVERLTTPPPLPLFSSDGEEVKNPEFLGLEIVGQLWGEFLIAESHSNDGEFFVIDQHGAAERAAFEKLKKRFYGEGVRRQLLLLPERIETTPDEKDAILASIEYIEKMGFEIIPFGPSLNGGGESFLIKSVPDILKCGKCDRLISELAEELSSVGGSLKVEEKIEGALMRIACHSVIRGPRPLAREEGAALLKELSKIDFASHCPHGRPVVKKYSRKEIESAFKR